jgi:hypothetical protein
MRRDVDEKLAADGINVISHDIKEGVVLDAQGVKVTALLVDRGLLAPACGYRVDYGGSAAPHYARTGGRDVHPCEAPAGHRLTCSQHRTRDHANTEDVFRAASGS